jgi:hypothetical protein
MSINQLIAGGIQLPRFESPMNMMAQLSQLESAREANELRKMQMAQMQRQQEQEMGLMNALQSGQPLSFQQALLGGRTGLSAFELQQGQLEAQRKRAETERLQRAVPFAVAAQRAVNTPVQSPGESDALLSGARHELASLGISSPEIDGKFASLKLLGTPEARREGLMTLVSSIPGLEEMLTAQSQRRAAVAKTEAEVRKLNLEAGQVGEDKPTADMLNYRQAQQQGFEGTFVDYKQALRPAPVSVSVGGQEGALQRKLGEAKAGIVEKGFDTAQDARSVIETLGIGRQILDQGATTGFGANFLVNVGQALKQVGVNLNSDESANAQTYMATMAQNVGRIIKQFGAGTGLSNADREYAEKMAGGNITLDERALRRILDINDKLSRTVISKHNDNVRRFKAGDEFLIEEPTAAKSTLPPQQQEALEWARRNPNDPRSAEIMRLIEGKR